MTDGLDSLTMTGRFVRPFVEEKFAENRFTTQKVLGEDG